MWRFESLRTFMPTARQRADLISSGWRAPPQPRVHRVRVVLGDDGRLQVLADNEQLLVLRRDTDRASVVVDLIEGVFDVEWR